MGRTLGNLLLFCCFVAATCPVVCAGVLKPMLKPVLTLRWTPGTPYDAHGRRPAPRGPPPPLIAPPTQPMYGRPRCPAQVPKILRICLWRCSDRERHSRMNVFSETPPPRGRARPTRSAPGLAPEADWSLRGVCFPSTPLFGGRKCVSCFGGRMPMEVRR